MQLETGNFIISARRIVYSTRNSWQKAAIKSLKGERILGNDYFLNT
jgi:hypothetical protein